MNVKCRERRCFYCTNKGGCTADEIVIDEDGCCESYDSYTRLAEDYQNKFYKHMKSINDGHLCKKECFGKRIERFGFVFYTEDDDRYEPDNVGLTEEISGYYVGHLSELTEERCEEIKKRIAKMTPVKDEPDGIPWVDW